MVSVILATSSVAALLFHLFTRGEIGNEEIFSRPVRLGVVAESDSIRSYFYSQIFSIDGQSLTATDTRPQNISDMDAIIFLVDGWISLESFTGSVLFGELFDQVAQNDTDTTREALLVDVVDVRDSRTVVVFFALLNNERELNCIARDFLGSLRSNLEFFADSCG